MNLTTNNTTLQSGNSGTTFQRPIIKGDVLWSWAWYWRGHRILWWSKKA